MADERVFKALKKSGMISMVGVVAAFRGAHGLRYQGTIWGKFYWWYEAISDISIIINAATIFARLIEPGEKMSDRCMSGFPFVSCVLCLFMSLYLRIRSEKFRDLLDSYENIFENTTYPEHIDAEIAQQSKTVRRMTTVLVTLEFIPMFTMCMIIPAINEMTNLALGPRKLSVPSRFPFDPLANFVNYLPIMILHTCGAVFVNFKKIAFEETLFIFATRQIAMVRHLKHNLGRIFDSLAFDERGYLENKLGLADASWREENIQRRLKQWAQNHQDCLRVFRDLETLYSWPLAIYLAMTTLILCTVAYVTADEAVEPERVVICSAFAFGIILELLFICQMGHLMTYEVNELNHALSGKNAFLLNKREHSSLRMILTRCRHESVMKAVNLFPLSLTTAQSVLSTSYSYFVMIKIVNGEDAKT